MGKYTNVLVSPANIYLMPAEYSINRLHFHRDADSKDSNFRICPHPKHENLFIASAGSLHGFKFLPTIGKYVADMIEGRLDKKYLDLWRWRFGEEPPASNIERHPYPSRDLAQLDGWKGRNSRAAL